MVNISKNWSELIKPSKLLVNIIKDNIAEITVEPLETGFGLTLGNSLRRILLSSLQGAAITHIKIDGVVHEFTSVPGVKEDVVDIVLNLKSVIVQMRGSEKKKLSLKAYGPCTVTASMIETGHDVSIFNGDLEICTLADGASLNIELICQTGKGYLSSTQLRTEDDPIGLIPIDALFSPVKKVLYRVDNSRVGHVTDLDKLILTVETDGTVTQELAVGLAARIMQDQMQLFISFEETVAEKENEAEVLPFDPNLLRKVDELELSVRSQNCLKNDNIVYIGDLVIKSEGEMLRTPNFGRKSLNEIKEVLGTMNLGFGMVINEWPPEKIEELAKKYENPF